MAFTKDKFTNSLRQEGVPRISRVDGTGPNAAGEGRPYTETETEVELERTLPVAGANVFNQQVKNERNDERSYLVEREWTDVSGWKTKENSVSGLEGFICDTLVETTIVAAGSNPDSLTLKLISSTVKQISSTRAIKTNVTVSYVVLVDQEQEPLTKLLITNTRTVVANGTEIEEPVADFSEVSVRDVDCERAIKTVSTIESSDVADFNDVDDDTFNNLFDQEVNYTFPGYLGASTSVGGQLANDINGQFITKNIFFEQRRRSAFTINPHVESSRPRTVKADVTVTLTGLSAGKPTADTIQQFDTMDAVFSGQLIRLNLQRLLSNQQTLQTVVNSNDVYHKNESFTIPNTNPTASAYITLISNQTKFIISSPVELWRFNLWMKRKVEVVAQ